VPRNVTLRSKAAERLAVVDVPDDPVPDVVGWGGRLFAHSAGGEYVEAAVFYVTGGLERQHGDQ